MIDLDIMQKAREIVARSICEWRNAVYKYDATQAIAKAMQEIADRQIPDGWQLVPKKLTREMNAEINLTGTLTDQAMQARYTAMLAAAPEPPREAG